MLRRRSTQRGPSPCPVCDADLEDTIASQSAPTCPHCGAALRPVRVAGFWRRVAAALVDLLILIPTAGLLGSLLLWWVGPPPITHAGPGLGALLDILAAQPRTLVGRAAPFALMMALYLVLFWSLLGQTPGGRLLELRVIDGTGHPPSLATSCMRVVGLVLGLVPGGLGALWIPLDLEKRGLHDHLARTLVVEARP